MPVHADDSPNILWPLPAGVPAFSVSNVFPPEMLEELKDIISREAIWGPGSENIPNNHGPYHTISGRWVSSVKIPDHIWNYVEDLGRKKWGRDDLKLKVMWQARYQQYQGITPYLWEHMDQPGTQYTMDICIESHGIDSWGVIVDGERFEEGPNTGIFFMAQQQAHSRPAYPVDDPEAYLILLFCMFVSSDHWMYDLDTQDPLQKDTLEELTEKYRYDGDIRYYEYSGHAANFSGLPEGNTPCPNDCQQCYVVEPDFIERIEGYVHRG